MLKKLLRRLILRAVFKLNLGFCCFVKFARAAKFERAELNLIKTTGLSRLCIFPR
ncbi:hypothetical protein CAMRE0001_2921 [Campylobacter rectus RM3267]|uniref:Uncharacterized protein n=1 Tax=Campylobacter rectus RM3267 TaxID=553218 RepID=B9D279_CAMRE|nr:hypothetical protein CAMRE0001_2921 [Campylobacter rectus RM3267]